MNVPIRNDSSDNPLQNLYPSCENGPLRGYQKLDNISFENDGANGGHTVYSSQDGGYARLFQGKGLQALGLCYRWDQGYVVLWAPEGKVDEVARQLKGLKAGLGLSPPDLSPLTDIPFRFHPPERQPPTPDLTNLTKLENWPLVDDAGNPLTEEQKQTVVAKYLAKPPPLLLEYDPDNWRPISFPLNEELIALFRVMVGDSNNQYFRQSKNGSTYYVAADPTRIYELRTEITIVINHLKGGENLPKDGQNFKLDQLENALHIVAVELKGEEFSFKNIIKGGLFLTGVFGPGVALGHDLYALVRTLTLFGPSALTEQMDRLWFVRLFKWIFNRNKDDNDDDTKGPPTTSVRSEPRGRFPRAARSRSRGSSNTSSMCVEPIDRLIHRWIGDRISTNDILHRAAIINADVDEVVLILAAYGRHDQPNEQSRGAPSNPTVTTVTESQPWYQEPTVKGTVFGLVFSAAVAVGYKIIQAAPEAATTLGSGVSRGMVLFLVPVFEEVSRPSEIDIL
ncbi:MAG: hypothetical protein HYU97_03905 [Deltaproteobacteria bacterium]|nr:hypothetical protein [Deltaproteobacteria bacterium]